VDAVGRSWRGSGWHPVDRVAGAHVRARTHVEAPACRHVAAGLSVRRGRGAASRGGDGSVVEGVHSPSGFPSVGVRAERAAIRSAVPTIVFSRLCR
jgi:hypothetical protein